MVHFGLSTIPTTFAGEIYSVTQGRASVLFALLAGIAVTLASGGAGRFGKDQTAKDTQEDGKNYVPARSPGKLLLRAALLLPLGLWLQRLDHGALVILQYYALYFVLAAALLDASSRVLFRGAAAALIGGPMVYLLFATGVPAWFEAGPATLSDPAAKVARDLVISGDYPLITWAAPLLLGMWLGRLDLGSALVQKRLLAGGAAMALAAAAASHAAPGLLASQITTGPRNPQIQEFLFTGEPHSQSILWMASALGSACLVLGAALVLAASLPRAAWPLEATGQLALSVYVTHLIAIDLTGGLLDRTQVLDAVAAVAAFMAAAAVFSVLWRIFAKRGPLETLLAVSWRLLERLLDLRCKAERKPHGGSRDG